MKNKIFRSLCVLLLAGLGLLLMAGCTPKDDGVNLLIYMPENEDTAGAYELGVNLSEGKLNLATEPLYRLKKYSAIGTFNRDTIYPVCINDSGMVLREEPLEVFDRPYAVLEQSKWQEYSKGSTTKGDFVSFKQIWNGDTCLNYTADEKKESYKIKRGEETIGVLRMEVNKNERYEPLAFFIDKDGSLAVIATRTKGSADMETYPVSIIAEKKEGGYFEAAQKHSFQGMFDETLSRHSAPYSYRFGKNIYGDAKSECFYWNESCNIVKINPYDGSFEILLQSSNLERDIPTLDAERESYDFIWSYGRQNGTNILIFPNYNDVQGMIAAFYNDEGSYLGRLLVKEDAAALFDKENKETSRIEKSLLGDFLYAAVC